MQTDSHYISYRIRHKSFVATTGEALDVLVNDFLDSREHNRLVSIRYATLATRLYCFITYTID